MIINANLPPLTVKKVSLIYVAALRGDGSTSNPHRTAHFYYADDGKLVACYDPINGEPDLFVSLSNVKSNDNNAEQSHVCIDVKT